MSFSAAIKNTVLEDLSVSDWKKILKKEAFRGNHVAEVANAFKGKDLSALILDSAKARIYISEMTATGTKESKKLSLTKVKKCKGSWSFARLAYWIRKNCCCCCSKKEEFNANIENLAKAIHTKLQAELQKKRFPGNEEIVMTRNVLKKGAINFQVGEENPVFFQADYVEATNDIQIRNLLDNHSTYFKVNEAGQLVSIDDVPFTNVVSLADPLRDQFMACVKEALNQSATYGLSENKKFIAIKTPKRAAEFSPEAHLGKLSLQIKSAVEHKNHPRLKVTLLKQDLTESPGDDNGGVARDYLHSLIKGLCEDARGFFTRIKFSSLYLPKISTVAKPEEFFPAANLIEANIFYDLGRAMMFCHRSKLNTEDVKNNNYVTGEHFDRFLFDLVLELRSQFVIKEFSDLSEGAKVNLAKIIFKCFYLRENAGTKHLDEKLAKLMPLFHIFNWQEGDALDPFMIPEAAAGDFFGDFVNDTYDSVDQDAVNADPQGFVNTLKLSLLNYQWNGTSVCQLIAPAHAIAQGMFSVCQPQSDQASMSNHWDTNISGSSAQAFSDKIQGKLDRQGIINAFTIKTKILGEDGLEADLPGSQMNEIARKTEWLKNWIQKSETSDKAVRRFLTCMTGTNALPQGERLHIIAAPLPDMVDGAPLYNPIPAAETCKFALILSPVSCPASVGSEHDSTESAFHAILDKYIGNVDSFDFTKD